MVVPLPYENAVLEQYVKETVKNQNALYGHKKTFYRVNEKVSVNASEKLNPIDELRYKVYCWLN